MLVVVLLTIGVATNVKAEEENLEQNSNANFEQVDGNKKLYDEDGQPIYVYPFKEGDEEIKVWLPYGSSVELYRKSNKEDELDKVPTSDHGNGNAVSDNESSLGELVQLEYDCYEVKEIDYEKGGYKEPVPRFRDGHTSYYGMNQQFTIPLYAPLNTEQKKIVQKLKDDLTKGVRQNRCPSKQIRNKIPVNKDETLTFLFASNGFYNGKMVYRSIPENHQVTTEEADTSLETTTVQENQKLSNSTQQAEQREQPNTKTSQTWTQRAKERINKAWKDFKYYCNPMNWFSYWKS